MIADNRSHWLRGIERYVVTHARGVEKDRSAGVLGLSAVDSTGVTRFRVYVFSDRDEALAAATLEVLLDAVDPV
jgi:hypothetical protein